MEGFITDWLNLALRWFHVIAAIAWIGESFYFVALDNSLKPPTDPNQRKRGVFGELWHVHGGGFYNMQKYTVAPESHVVYDGHFDQCRSSGISGGATVYFCML